MADDLSQYKDLFVQTGKEYLQSLNASLLKLEKDPGDKEAVAEVFRSAHSLKGQSAAMGYEKTGYLCHAVEDVFFEIKEGRFKVTPELADLLFAALDALTDSIGHIEANGQETDLSPQAEALKQLSGIKTEGAGKTEHTDEAANSPVASQPTPPEKPTMTSETPKVVDTPTHETPAVVQPSIHIKTIPVKVEQLDEMMNLLEELIVYRLTLKRLVGEIGNSELSNYRDQVDKITEALQFQIMSIRAVPVKLVFDHFPRAVRDLAREENKQIELVVEGGELELDRTIVERLDEPLTHIIRNAASHGIKSSGTIRLSAKREKDYAVVEVTDDGGGVDWGALAKKANVQTDDPNALKQLLFSGISTAETVSQVSGRGVGLEVVKKTIEEFGGTIDVTSEKGKGTTFIIKLPLTLAVMQALLIRVGTERYAIPVSGIDRSVKITNSQIRSTAHQEAFVLEDTEIPLIRLADKFKAIAPTVSDVSQEDGLLVVVVIIGDERVGFVVDEVIETSEVIIKPSPDILKDNPAFAGATILGDGRSALILNPQGIM